MINNLGMISALTTILTIWFGHVFVRKLEARLKRIFPVMLICVLLGITFGIGAWISFHNSISAVSGIIAITFLWDALEFVRQEKRVKIGHAPAKLHNPRHARILAEYPSATTVDILDREPRGVPYTQAEIDLLLHPLEFPSERQPE